MKTASTQTNIPIAGMKDGILIMRDGQYRLVLELASINFELKSEQEQNAIVFAYQSFLNSLNFPIEIVIQSKKLDLSPYLKKIKDLSVKQANELIKIQTADYVDFVEQLIQLANIMKKRFYVVVGITPLSVSNGFLDKLFKHNQPQVKLKISESDFNSYAKELRQRAQNVAQGLGSIGLHCRQLTTQEVIELFYEVYNPEVAGKERLDDANEVSGSYITQLKHDETQQEPTATPPVSKADAAAPQTAQGGLIDNKEVVTAAQQEKARQIALENAQATNNQATGDQAADPEKSEPDVNLPGEEKAEEKAQPLPPEQQDTENYGL